MSTNKCTQQTNKRLDLTRSIQTARVYTDVFNKICELTYIDPGNLETHYCNYNAINKCIQPGFLGFGCVKRESKSIWEAWHNNPQNCPKDRLKIVRRR